MERTLNADQLRYKELVGKCGLTHEEAIHALGRGASAAPGYERLSRTEKTREIDRLRFQAIRLVEAQRIVGLHKEPAQVTASEPAVRMSTKAQRKDAKRHKEFAGYYHALTRPELRGLKGARK